MCFKRLLLGLLALSAVCSVTLGMMRWQGYLLLPQEADPPAWEVFGVDVSAYQGRIDWQDLREQGVDFAFIKATEGSSLQDRYFADNWAAAQAAGATASWSISQAHPSPSRSRNVL